MKYPDSYINTKTIDAWKKHIEETGSNDSTFQHLRYMQNGYRDFMVSVTLNEFRECPFSPDSPRAISWNAGFSEASKEFDINSLTLDVEIKKYIEKVNKYIDYLNSFY